MAGHRVRGSSLVLRLAVVATLTAGCLQGPAPSLEASAPAPITSFRMEGRDCEEAGWIAMYSGERTFAGVWQSDDIRPEYGYPIHDSVGSPSPLLLPQNANQHIGFTCDVAVVNGEERTDYKFGFVGQQIKPPPWDPGGADRHILIGGMSFENGTFADALRAVTTADITHTLSAYTEWTIPRDQPRSFAYSEYHDLEKGIYQSWSTLGELRVVPERTYRFWWQVPADGSQAHIWTTAHDHDGGIQPEGTTWHPVYWDMHTTGGRQYVTPWDGAGAQEHNFGLLPKAAGGTAEHYPPFSQPCLHTFYEHGQVTFTSGAVFEDVVLDDIWMH